MAAIVESMAIKEAEAPRGGGEFDLSSTFVLSIGTGVSKFFASPPGIMAGVAWWNPAKLINLFSLSQSQGAQFQAAHLLGERLERVEFPLPQGDWSLDNVKRLDEMIHIGKERAAEDISRLKESFFSKAAPKFRPFPTAGSILRC